MYFFGVSLDLTVPFGVCFILRSSSSLGLSSFILELKGHPYFFIFLIFEVVFIFEYVFSKEVIL